MLYPTLELDHLTKELGKIANQEGIRNLHRWFHSNERWWVKLNHQLGLEGEPTEIQCDLPCLAVGSLRDLVVVGANPGFDANRNGKEESECRKSVNHYIGFMECFFDKYPAIIGGYSKWWSRAIPYLALLSRNRTLDVLGAGDRDLWDYAHRSGNLGGWDLFPFHSTSDGLTSKIFNPQFPGILEFAIASLKCIARIKPRILFISSQQGYVLSRLIFSELAWNSSVELGFPVARAQFDNDHEIVAVGRQVLSRQAFKRPGEVISLIQRLRAE
jgi:hypothetical protein